MRFDVNEHAREGYVFETYEQALSGREQAEYAHPDVVASG